MWNRHLSRRRFLTLSSAALASQLLDGARAQPDIGDVLRIGAVLPTKTGDTPLEAFSEFLAGEAARLGAIMGEEEVGAKVDSLGKQLKVLVASAPDGDAALRAAERLTSVGEVFALIGGIGAEQATVLSQVAEKRQVPFFNIGTSSDILRGGACNRHTFHVEASAAMYLDALVTWFTRAGYRRWFFVQADTVEHKALYYRAVQALGMRQRGGNEVGRAIVDPAQPVFLSVFNDIRMAEADVVVLLTNAPSQLVFLGQYESSGLKARATGFPSPMMQTREFYAALHEAVPNADSGYRAALWEATLNAQGARELNARFLGRWGQPMDPSAWAAYASVKILVEGASAVGTLEGSKLIPYLESSETVFDVYKGATVSFRPWDHQLRQPLYLVKIDPETELGPALADRVALANLVAELPDPGQTRNNATPQLDRLGIGPSESECQF